MDLLRGPIITHTARASSFRTARSPGYRRPERIRHGRAAVVGRAMLVRDIPGNAAVVMSGINGLLYGGDDAFVAAALRLLADPLLRRSLARPAPDRAGASSIHPSSAARNPASPS